VFRKIKPYFNNCSNKVIPYNAKMAAPPAIKYEQHYIATPDRILKRIYSYDISGSISLDMFLQLSADHEAEQKYLQEKVSKPNIKMKT